ncbi:hypothetical protein JOF53_000984 [Crossiella equi]|uniref:DUF6545 domain-containing protein n=1 Tax=Crossiella equi TaxID=130796 RepID=A0ABS5A7A0_9PSEU|nr:MAB_1171c family putative transporter [Crossiella equi]MBP2472112.1 hypothetical protein [Crossiella equi]
MTALYAAAVYTALAWVVFLLIRRPHDVRLRAMVCLVVCWAAAFPFGGVASADRSMLGFPPMGSRFVEHTLVLVSVNCLIAFFLYSALEERAARARTRRYAVPLVLAIAVLAVSALLTPADAVSNDHSVPSIAVFYLTADTYMAIGFGMACFWTLRYGKGAEPRLARGLRLASLGLAAMVAANLLFIPTVIVRWAGSDVPTPVTRTAVLLLLNGIVVFLFGVSYPGGMMRLAGVNVWWQHLRLYRRLSPLWTMLNERFPQDAMDSLPTNTLRELYGLRGVHRRYYRRVIECRDGLVRISPYLTCDPPEGVEPLAEELRAALRLHAAGMLITAHAVPVAVPVADGLDADVAALVALSDALKASRR